MISDYIHPQLLIRQNLQTVSAEAVDRMNVLVVGPQYVAVNLEEDTVTKNTFNSAGDDFVLSFTDSEDNTFTAGTSIVVDESSIRVFVEGVQGELLDSTSFASGEFGVEMEAFRTSPRTLSLPSDSSYVLRQIGGSGDLLPGLRGRSLQVGDLVSFKREDTNTEVVRTITGFVGALAETSFGSNDAADNEEFATSLANLSQTVSNDIQAAVVPDNYDALSVGIGSFSAFATSSREQGYFYTASGANYLGEAFQITLTEDLVDGVESEATFITSQGTVQGTCTVQLDIEAGTGTLTFVIEELGSDLTIELIDDEILPQEGEQFTIVISPAFTPQFANIISTSGTYEGEVDNTFTVTINNVNGTTNFGLRISDEKGTFAAYNINNITSPIGADYTFEIADTGISVTIDREAAVVVRKGDKYVISGKAGALSTTQFSGVTLDAPVNFDTGGTPSNTFFARFRKAFTGEYDTTQLSDGEEFWSVSTTDGETSLSYDATLTIFESGRNSSYKYIPLVDEVGSIYAVWRGLVKPTATEKVILIDPSDTVEEKLGRVSLQNDLGFAARLAKQGSQDRRVYALRTEGTNAAAFTKAMKKVERNDLIYAIAVITDDIAAIKVVSDHCTAMSAENIKNFRRCYFGTDSPGEYTAIALDSSGIQYRATVADYSGDNILVNFTSDPFLTLNNISEGDFVELEGVKYEVDEVINSTQLLLKEGPATIINPSVPVKVIKADTADNTVDFVIQRSQAINNRRAVNVWCEEGVGLDEDGEYAVIPNRFVAAEVAGLRVAQVPWIGLSRTEITGLVEAPLMYSKYTLADLDRAAANGVWIITQELEGGDVFIRHQLTTDVSSGILYYEDSVGTNYDNISFKIKDGIESTVIGKRNVNRETLAYIRTKVFEILKDATMADARDSVGPQLISFQDEDGNPFAVTVKVHPTFKDRILVRGKIEMPVPNNITDVELEAVIGLTI